jgi:hypothetical protein
MIYIVVEGIVSGLFEATVETAIDPFDGQSYKVKKYKGGDTLNNFSDWKIFDCNNAAIALLMAATADKSARLRKKIRAQEELRYWVLNQGVSFGFSPAKAPRDWLKKQKQNRNFDPFALSPQDWLEVYPEANAIPDTSGHSALVAMYGEPFGLEWIKANT